MNRSSPANAKPTSEWEPRAFMASAARYKPTGHPSVCATSSRTTSSAGSTPAPSSSERASDSPIARSSTPISRMVPSARRRAEGSGSWLREPTASCDPAGRPKTSCVTASRHSRLVTISRWSSTIVIGPPIPAMAEASRWGPLVAALEEATVRNTAGLIGSIRSTAAATWVSRTAGSLSRSSAEIHPTRGALRSAHCARSVVLP